MLIVGYLFGMIFGTTIGVGIWIMISKRMGR